MEIDILRYFLVLTDRDCPLQIRLAPTLANIGVPVGEKLLTGRLLVLATQNEQHLKPCIVGCNYKISGTKGGPPLL